MKTVEYYLSKGLDRSTAEYFANGRRQIVSVVPHDDFSLTLCFDNGETKRYDVVPLLEKGTVFETFANIEHFRRVYLDENHCVAWDIDPSVDSRAVWNNKVDLCPDECYLHSVTIGGETRA